MFHMILLLVNYYTFTFFTPFYNNFNTNNYYNSIKYNNFKMIQSNYINNNKYSFKSSFSNFIKNNQIQPFFNINYLKHINRNINLCELNLDPNLIINKKTDVYIHIEKLYARLPIYHIGVTFYNGYKSVRYDYRPFNENGSYITNYKDNTETFKNNIIKSKTIYWGQTNLSLEEIHLYQKNIVENYPKYRLGINDCRHYANKLTKNVCEKPTPIWKLYKLWNK